ncbi:MAG TPA: DUF5666 domain-containing protein [Gammaproteobacteria bacterium]|nr:DUF5666 domain-containing protein [Gammaproteobacteria bacterium]
MIRGGRYVLLGVAALAAVHACDTGAPTAGIDRGGVRTPVAAQGPITGFGSIVVGGVHYSLSAAEVRIDGALAAEADLALGQIVAITGSREPGSDRADADTVTFLSNAQGPVTRTDAGLGTFAVLGQTVSTDAATVFDLGGRPPAVASLVVGETVRVSGFVAANGTIAAARVEQWAAASELRVTGHVARLNLTAARFDINALTVSYASAAVIEGFPNGQPNEGDEVIVVGRSVAPNGAFLADTLERRTDAIPRREGDEFEVEGLITRFVSPQDFDVANVAVTTTATTQYEHGSAASLTLDLRVHVSGRVNAALELEARRVEIED